MTNAQIPTIFDSFNARALLPSQVAATFVPSEQFAVLCKRRHTVVFGPRGSGKTTLLKMLQPPALRAWHHVNADAYRASVDFTGVFVATDISWGAQLKALGQGRLDSVTHELLGRAAFTTHVLRALTVAMLQRARLPDALGEAPFRSVILSEKAEQDVVAGIARAWYISPQIPTLISLKHALTARLSAIREFASKEVSIGEVGRGARTAAESFMHLHFLQAAGVAVELFDDYAGTPDSKWALMVDELELAPEWIRQELIRSLRSADDRFLFKLAMSPFSHDLGLLGDADAPQSGHDYDEITLWYAEKRDGYAFCQDLLSQMLSAKGFNNVDARQFLGPSYFETPSEEWRGRGTAYGPGSRLGRRFVRLAQVDASFKRYLDSKGIDPQRLEHVSSADRASDIRKIAPLVAVRDWYRKQNPAADAESLGRSRKTMALYSGTESLFAVTEGNPRWFIAIVSHLLDRWTNRAKPVDPSAQADELAKASQRFSAMLRTIPVEGGLIRGRPRGVLALLSTIAEWFRKEALGSEFAPDPRATFTVDANLPDALVVLIGQALNAGALVYVPDDNAQTLLRSLRGRRFRIAYLLAARHGLPLRLGRAISLGVILREERFLNAATAQLNLNPPAEG